MKDVTSVLATTSTAEKETPLFDKVVRLHVGEALVFAPSAIVSLKRRKDGGEVETVALGSGHLKLMVRNRLTTDGGVSVMANGI